MHVYALGTYKEARALCEGKRYDKMGRRLDNYTSIILLDRDTPKERIGIAFKRWNSNYKSDGTTPNEKRIILGEPFAFYHPDNRVTCNKIGTFTAHQLGTLFNVEITRDRHNYRVLKDRNGKMVMADSPVTLLMDANGYHGHIVDGAPVPLLAKDSDASREWAREKREFDKVFTVTLKLGGYTYILRDEKNHSKRYPRWTAGNVAVFSAAHFVECIRTRDHTRMVTFVAEHLGPYTTTWAPETVAAKALEIYQQYYRRQRRDILVAAGARVDTQ